MTKFAFNTLGALAAGVWLVLLLKIIATLLELSAYRPAKMGDILSIVIPLIGFAAAAWVGFCSGRRLSRPAAVVLELVLAAVGLFFLTVVAASRAG
jgi:hypothetical protein